MTAAERAARRNPSETSSDPTPEIPAVESGSDTLTLGEQALHGTYDPNATVAAAALTHPTPPPQPGVSSPAPLPRPRNLAPVPRQMSTKDVRTIRVRTLDGVNMVINADRFDPELHTPLSDNDKKWGDIAVKAKKHAEDTAEQEAYIKRLVRGRG